MKQDDRDIEFVRQQLRAALPPLGDAELDTDLWPRMLRRLEDKALTFGWFEFVLAAAAALAFAIFPELLTAMLYHL